MKKIPEFGRLVLPRTYEKTLWDEIQSMTKLLFAEILEKGQLNSHVLSERDGYTFFVVDNKLYGLTHGTILTGNEPVDQVLCIIPTGFSFSISSKDDTPYAVDFSLQGLSLEKKQFLLHNTDTVKDSIDFPFEISIESLANDDSYTSVVIAYRNGHDICSTSLGHFLKNYKMPLTMAI